MMLRLTGIDRVPADPGFSSLHRSSVRRREADRHDESNTDAGLTLAAPRSPRVASAKKSRSIRVVAQTPERRFRRMWRVIKNTILT